MISILMDCDPGHDDIFALLTAIAHPEVFEILGFTTVAGNQTVEKVTDNLLRVLSYIDYDIPVSMGAKTSLNGQTFVQPQAHGESGMDGPLLPAASKTVTGLDAVIWMKNLLVSYPRKITIVATGPLTNIARLLTDYPEVKEHIDSIAIMGGSLYSGNITSMAEFNIYVDPEAAEIVFNSGCKIIMSGLEVCQAAMIHHDEIKRFNNSGKVSKLVYELLEFYSLYAKKLNQPGSPLFDLCPIMHLILPDIFTSIVCQVNVETEGKFTRGKTVADLRSWADTSLPNAEVLIDVKRQDFINEFVSSMNLLDRKVS